MLKDKDKAMLASYGRSMLAAVVALAVTGNVTAGANVTAANLVATSSIRTATGANIIMAPNTYLKSSKLR